MVSIKFKGKEAMNTSSVHYTEVRKFGKQESFVFDVISNQSKDILEFNGKKNSGFL